MTPPQESEPAQVGPLPDSPLHQGLRERKKQLMRELISDTATLMFLERGYDEVKVSEIATACDVSEKTIYNYFPTKESLILDREEDAAKELRKAFGPDSPASSPVEAMVGVLQKELENFVFYMNAAEHVSFPQVADFNDLIDSTPALKAARAEMIERLAQIAASAMAERAGIDPEDPEPQIAADALTSLWRIFYRAVVKYSVEDLSSDELRESVMGDVQRAARLLDAGLWSFGSAGRASASREEFSAAADASLEARKEVLAALKAARTAWMAIRTEIESHAHDDHEAHQHTFREMHDAHRAVHDAHREAFEIRREARQRAQELRDEARARRGDGRQRGQELRDEARRRRDAARERGQELREEARTHREEARKLGEKLKDEIKKEIKQEARQRGQEIKDAVKRGRGGVRP
ncbi:MAG TPA: TetR family transcriptional regulator [Acidimicrobiales bacterium]